MRYKFSEKIDQKVGDERVVEKFLIFPKTINDEMRWLETAKILQQYVNEHGINQDNIGFYFESKLFWKDIRFVDDL